MASPSDPAALADLHLGDLVHSSAKAELRTGQFRGRRVLVKRLLSSDAFWRAKFEHELRIYHAFQTFPPPMRVPELLWTDDHTCMVIEEIPGQVVDDRRYPLQVLPRQIWAAAIIAVRTFSTWSPPHATLPIVFDYPDRLDRENRKGLIADRDRAALAELLGICGQPASVAHGDPLPANLLMTDRDCVLLDYEFTGLFLPAFDLAMLHALLDATPAAQHAIEDVVTEEGLDAPFTVNQAIVISRERRIHAELPAGAQRDRRLTMLHQQWTRFQNRLHYRR